MMRSKITILMILLLVILGASQTFASTLVPVPAKVPKGAYVNGGGQNSDDNFYWQRLTLTPAAAHANGTAFTIYLPTGMTLADVNNDGDYLGELSVLWDDAAGDDLTSVYPKSINSARNALRFTFGVNDVTNGTFDTDATGWTLVEAAYETNDIRLTFVAACSASQDLDLVDGKKYIVTYSITNASGADNLIPKLGGTALTTRTAVGTYSQIVDAGTTDDLLKFTLAAGNKDIDDVFVIPYEFVDEDFSADATGWDLGTGWAWNDATDLVEITAESASNGNLTYNIGAFSGQMYKVIFTATEVAVNLTVSIGGSTPAAVATGAGETHYITAGTTGSSLEFIPDATYKGTVTDVSCVAVGVEDGDFAVGTQWAVLSTGAVAGAVMQLDTTELAEIDCNEAAGEYYTVIYDITAYGDNAGVIQVSIGGADAASTETTAGTYIATIGPTVNANNLIFTENGTGDCGIDNIIVIKHSTSAIGDVVYIMMPVETKGPTFSPDDYYIDFLDGTTDDIADGAGSTITYVDPAPNAISLVNFEDNLSADNDTTNALGDRYPTGLAATFGALPDLVPDSGDGYIPAPNVGISVDGTEDGDETLYAVWISTEPGLAHIDSLISAEHAATYPGLTNYLINEGNVGNTQYLIGSGVPEGSYYFYITSYLTGNFILARSGELVVRHWPVISILGCDRDHDIEYTQGVGDDDQNVTLDSGGYYNYAGAKTAADFYTYIDLFTRVDDLDDNALVYLFYSTNAALDTSHVATSGSAVDTTLVVTGMKNDVGTLIVADLLENEVDEQGYIMYRWEVHPDSLGSILASASYSIYTVTTDGKHLDMTSMQGDIATNITVNVKHSPKLTIDNLYEYDSDGNDANGVQVNVQDHDVIMLSWGRNGADGDADFDDNALIEFYIDVDGFNADETDYSHTDAIQLRADALSQPTVTHKIAYDIAENPDDKSDSWYEWNLKEDFETSGWYPTAGTPYFIYGIIDEKKETNNTARVVMLGSVLPVKDDSVDLSAYHVVFTTSAFARVIDPSAEGVTVNGIETYRIRFNAFDWETDAKVGIFLVDTTNFPTGPHTLEVCNLDSTNVKAYCLTDNNGDHTDGTNAWLSENSVSYYDMTLLVPPATANPYTKTMNSAASALDDDTYWVYIGGEKEDITEKVDEGDFGAAGDWDTGAANWGIAAGIASDTGGAADALEQDVTAVAGVEYCIEYDVVATTTEGTLQVGIGGATATARTLLVNAASVSYREYITATGTGNLTFTSNAAWVGDIDNVSVVPNPTLYRAPGALTLKNTSLTTTPQMNLYVSPMNLTAAMGDTINYTIRVTDTGSDNVSRIDLYIAVEKDYWTVVDSNNPFTAATGYSGKLFANEVIDDSTNNRWILRTVVSNSGVPFTITDNGLGDALVTLKLVSKGTSVALENTTSVYFMNESSSGYVTKFNTGAVNFISSTVKVVPRAIIEGIVELQGRDSNAIQITFELRERGSYVPTSDPDFMSQDEEPAITGLQFTPDSNGKFTLLKVPSGEYDLVAVYNRYLSRKIQVNTYSGIDTLFVSFGTLLGGDCFGYVDTDGAVMPDNQVTTDDINRIESALTATPSSSEWDDGENNWKWADINEDDVVEVDDLSMAEANAPNNGAYPVFKPAVSQTPLNGETMFELINIPEKLVAGKTYTFQVVASNVSNIRAYFVNFYYNNEALSFEGIRKGDFIQSDSHSFPVVKESTVGLVNSAYGAIISGDGVLVEVSFTAKRDGEFTADMLKFERISFANADFRLEKIQIDQLNETISDAIPVAFGLSQNFPNPFNPTTAINFSIPDNGHVKLKIYDILGRHVRTLVDGYYSPGNYSIVWNARDMNGNSVSAGVYLYTITAVNHRSTRKMILMK